MTDRVIENCVEWLDGDDRVAVTLSARQKRIQNRIIKEKEKHDRVVDYIVNADGSMTAHVPITWVKILPPRRMELTEEQRLALSDRMRNARNQQQSIQNSERFGTEQGIDEEVPTEEETE